MRSPNNPVDLDLADRDWYLDELYIDWRAASAAADAAYLAWKAWPDRDRYAAYVAATEQADAAADHLAAAHQLDRAADTRPYAPAPFRLGMSRSATSRTGERR